MNRTRRWRRIGLSFIGLAAILGCFLWFIGVFGGNFREVVPGELYRSAQLSGANLETAITVGNIKSVVNLRGPLGTDPTYVSELEICAKKKLAHDDLSFSASHYPRPDQLRRLIADFDRLPKPLLIHCYGGADRSGLASTIYLVLYKGVPLDEAENQQLTWRFGHMKWFNARAMDDFFDLYRSTSGGKDLRAWMLDSYPALFEERHLK